MFAILAVIFFAVGWLMLNRLKQYYKDFYLEFGCYLWMTNYLLTFPLLFRALFDRLRTNDDWYNFWILSNNYYRVAGYNIIIFTFASFLPMVMQIGSLIFGFLRSKKVKA